MFSFSTILSLLSLLGSLLPFFLLFGLVRATGTLLDTEASYYPRRRVVPGGWDSIDDEQSIFLTPRRPRHSPSALSRTASSVFSALFPFSQPRPIADTSLVISSPCPLPRPILKRPSARVSSPGVSQTSTLPLTYSHLTSSQNRSTSAREQKAIRKALRKGSSVSGSRSRSPCLAIDRPTKAPASPGHKNLLTASWSAGYPTVVDRLLAPFVRAPEPQSLSAPEKIKKTEVSSPVEDAQPAEAQWEVETYVETTFYPPAPAPTSLAAKLKFDGFRCGFAPLAAFSRSLQPFKPTLPLLAPSAPSARPQDAHPVESMVVDTLPSPPTPQRHVDPMVLDQSSRAVSPTSPSMTTTSPGILRKVSQITKQFANLTILPPPVDISSLVEMMARLSLNDNQEEAPIPQPTPARSRQIHQVKPQPTSLSARSPPAPASSSSGQPSSVPAPAATVKTEKKHIAPAPSRPSSSATSEPPKSATPATPQPPAGQHAPSAVPAGRRPGSLFARARKALSQKSGSQSAAPSSSGQPSPTKATALPPTEEKKKPTPTVSNSKPPSQPAASQQPATPSSSSQPSDPAQAGEAKKETPKLAKMGPMPSKLLAIFDQLEDEEDEAKTDKPKPKPKPTLAQKLTPKPEPEPKLEPKPEADSEADALDDPTFEDFEAQLAVEELVMENEKKSVPKYKGKGRKIMPLKRK